MIVWKPYFLDKWATEKKDVRRRETYNNTLNFTHIAGNVYAYCKDVSKNAEKKNIQIKPEVLFFGLIIMTRIVQHKIPVICFKKPGRINDEI